MPKKTALYETLGVPTDATPAQIRRAYRKRAAAAHPDNSQPVGDFFAIQKANRILADPEAKQIYDETGIVQGEDKLAEEAVMLIVTVSAQILTKDPECDLPDMLRATLAEMRKQNVASKEVCEKCIKQIEKRWKGEQVVRDTLLLNIHSRINEFIRKLRVFERAKELLEPVKYEPGELKPDDPLSIFLGRRDFRARF